MVRRYADTVQGADTAPATPAPRAAMTAEQRMAHDFRCYVRRHVDLDLAAVLTPKQRRLVRDLANRVIR